MQVPCAVKSKWFVVLYVIMKSVSNSLKTEPYICSYNKTHKSLDTSFSLFDVRFFSIIIKRPNKYIRNSRLPHYQLFDVPYTYEHHSFLFPFLFFSFLEQIVITLVHTELHFNTLSIFRQQKNKTAFHMMKFYFKKKNILKSHREHRKKKWKILNFKIHIFNTHANFIYCSRSCHTNG